jgi:hypothetical protein
LAQETRNVLPQAVTSLDGSRLVLADGSIIKNLLVVNERVLLFENIGATQELNRLLQTEKKNVGTLDNRVEKLEMEEKERLIENEERASNIEQLVDFVTSEDETLDPEDDRCCCYCSMCGVGPGWTL